MSGVLEAVDNVLEGLLPPAPALVEGKGKIVKDIVWGIIDLPGYLVPVVDSRLVQRQRRIRQLGLSYLVYPSAGYSRFEHALGCCHVMRQLLLSVKAKAPPGQPPPEPREGQLLLGALLHDIGHMPFSHASEDCVEEFEEQLLIGDRTVQEVWTSVREALVEKGEKPLRLAEVLSVLIIISRAFERFMEGLAPRDRQPREDFFLEVAAFVAGAKLSHADLAYSMTLSGPVDADRLDYMTRDALLAGVPVSLDIPRLLARCQFVEVRSLSMKVRQSASEFSVAPAAARA